MQVPCISLFVEINVRHVQKGQVEKICTSECERATIVKSWKNSSLWVLEHFQQFLQIFLLFKKWTVTFTFCSLTFSNTFSNRFSIFFSIPLKYYFFIISFSFFFFFLIFLHSFIMVIFFKFSTSIFFNLPTIIFLNFSIMFFLTNIIEHLLQW